MSDIQRSVVHFLCGTNVSIPIPLKFTGGELIEMAASYVQIESNNRHFFNLAYLSPKGNKCWVNKRKRILQQQIPQQFGIMHLYFHVCMFPPSFHELTDPHALHYIHWDVWRLLQAGTLRCEINVTATLTALHHFVMSQGTHELGDNEQVVAMLPAWMKSSDSYEICVQLTKRKREAMDFSDVSQATLKFLRVSEILQSYGYLVEKLKNVDNDPVWLGVNHMGISVFPSQELTSVDKMMPWCEVMSVNFVRGKLTITRSSATPGHNLLESHSATSLFSTLSRSRTSTSSSNNDSVSTNPISNVLFPVNDRHYGNSLLYAIHEHWQYFGGPPPHLQQHQQQQYANKLPSSLLRRMLHGRRLSTASTYGGDAVSLRDDHSQPHSRDTSLSRRFQRKSSLHSLSSSQPSQEEEDDRALNGNDLEEDADLTAEVEGLSVNHTMASHLYQPSPSLSLASGRFPRQSSVRPAVWDSGGSRKRSRSVHQKSRISFLDKFQSTNETWQRRIARTNSFDAATAALRMLQQPAQMNGDSAGDLVKVPSLTSLLTSYANLTKEQVADERQELIARRKELQERLSERLKNLRDLMIEESKISGQLPDEFVSVTAALSNHSTIKPVQASLCTFSADLVRKSSRLSEHKSEYERLEIEVEVLNTIRLANWRRYEETGKKSFKNDAKVAEAKVQIAQARLDDLRRHQYPSASLMYGSSASSRMPYPNYSATLSSIGSLSQYSEGDGYSNAWVTPTLPRGTSRFHYSATMPRFPTARETAAISIPEATKSPPPQSATLTSNSVIPPSPSHSSRSRETTPKTDSPGKHPQLSPTLEDSTSMSSSPPISGSSLTSLRTTATTTTTSRDSAYQSLGNLVLVGPTVTPPPAPANVTTKSSLTSLTVSSTTEDGVSVASEGTLVLPPSEHSTLTRKEAHQPPSPVRIAGSVPSSLQPPPYPRRTSEDTRPRLVHKPSYLMTNTRSNSIGYVAPTPSIRYLTSAVSTEASSPPGSVPLARRPFASALEPAQPRRGAPPPPAPSGTPSKTTGRPSLPSPSGSTSREKQQSNAFVLHLKPALVYSERKNSCPQFQGNEETLI